jgi:2'-5' RNA ligase
VSWAIKLFFDSRMDGAVRAIWSSLEELDLPYQMSASGYSPHLTLLGMEESNIKSAEIYLKNIAKQRQPFTLRVGAVGIFPQEPATVYLSPTICPELQHLYFYLIDNRKYLGANFSPYYLPDVWTPHITLACRLRSCDVNTVTSLVCAQFKPLAGEAHGIALVHIPSGEESFRIALGS